MNYAEKQRQPGRQATGITVVVVVHLILGYALVSGLARTVVDAIKKPLETKIVEEVKKPPPPETPPPPPPKMVQMLPTFVPPPEVQIQAPPVQQSIEAPRTSVAPPVYAPPAPPQQQVAAPPGPPSVGVACPNSQQVRSEIKYPIQARKDGIEGEVLVEFTVSTTGEIKDVEIKSSSNRIFNSVATSATRQFKCKPQAADVRVQVPYSFKLTG